MRKKNWICAFLVLLFSIIMGSGSYAQAAAVDAASLRQMFDQQGNPARWAYLKNKVDGFTLPWVETYVMRSYLIMYQATKDKSYIDAFVDHADSVLNRRDSVRKVTDHRGYSLPVWRNGDNADKAYYIYADETGLIATPLAQFGALVKADPNLASYKAKADVYVQAAKDAVNVLFMSELQNTEVSFTWIESGNQLYLNRPINKNLAVGSALLAIYEATGDKSYLDKGTKIANFFKQRLHINTTSDGYYWMYYPDDPLNRYNNTPEDTNHANVVVQFVKLAYNNGIFNGTDMQRFANTATKVLVKKDGTIAGRVDGSGTIAQQGMIASWLFFEPWAPSLFDTAYNIDANLQKNDEVVGLALLNYVFAQRNSTSQPPADPDPEPTPSTGDNLIENGNFSSGTTGWVNLNNTVVINTDTSGGKYLTNTYNFSFYQDLNVKAGGTYELNARTCKGTATKGARIVLRFYHQDGSESFNTFTYQNKGSGWEAMPEMTIEVPSTVTATKLYLSALPGDSGTQHFDDVTLAQAGDTPAPAPDTEAPVAVISSPAAGSALKDTVTLEATASDNVGVTQLTLAYATSAQGSWTTIGEAVQSGGSQTQGTWRLDWNVSGLANGTYYVKATARDAAGNTSASASVTYEITPEPAPDTEAPVAVISSPAAGSALKDKVTLEATASDNVGVTQLTLAYATSAQGSWTTIGEAVQSGGSQTQGAWRLDWNVFGLTNNTYYVRATARDAAGNTSASDSVTYEIKNIQDLIVNGNFSAGTTGWVNLNNTAVINTDTSGGKYLTNTYNFSFYQDLNVKAGGIYKLNAKTSKGTATKGARIVLRFYHRDGSESFNTFTYQNKGSGWEAMPEMTIEVPSTVTATKLYLSALPGDSGTQHFDDVTLAQAGDTPAPAPDTEAPVAVISSPAAGSALKDTVTLEATASDNVGVTQLTLAYATSAQGSWTTIGEAVQSGGSQTQGTWRLDWNVSGLTNNTYYVRATARDAAGNTSASDSVTYEITTEPAPDTEAPVAAISSPAAGSALKDTVTLEATARDNVGVTQLTLAYATSEQDNWTTIGEAVQSSGSQTQGTWRLDWNVSGLTNNTYYVRATARDAAGNTSASDSVTCEIKNIQDLIANGNFSSGTTGWVNLNNTAVINTDTSGGKYLTNTYNFSFYQDLNVKAGGTYELNARTCKGTATKGARIVLRFYHQDGSESFKTFTYQNKGSGWEAMPEMTIEVPSTAKATKMYLSALPGDSGTQHFDDINLISAS